MLEIPVINTKITSYPLKLIFELKGFWFGKYADKIEFLDRDKNVLITKNSIETFGFFQTAKFGIANTPFIEVNDASDYNALKIFKNNTICQLRLSSIKIDEYESVKFIRIYPDKNFLDFSNEMTDRIKNYQENVKQRKLQFKNNTLQYKDKLNQLIKIGDTVVFYGTGIIEIGNVIKFTENRIIVRSGKNNAKQLLSENCLVLPNNVEDFKKFNTLLVINNLKT